MTCDATQHDFRFGADDGDVVTCDCGQQMALFDDITGDMIAIRSVA